MGMILLGNDVSDMEEWDEQMRGGYQLTEVILLIC